MIIGYARVSTTGQSLDGQKEELLKNGAQYIYQEKKSGKNLSREALQDCLENLRAHDTLMVTKLDRLGRNTKDALNILDCLKENKINLKILDTGIDTNTPMGKFFYQLQAMFSELERNYILERTAKGREKAKREGKLTGRPLKHSNERIKLVMEDIISGLDIRESCKFRGVSVPTFYRRMKKLQQA
jgi:DNA invertase Pin-like site-specific DNA recombinase